jgi:hypothetical protein
MEKQYFDLGKCIKPYEWHGHINNFSPEKSKEGWDDT